MKCVHHGPCVSPFPAKPVPEEPDSLPADEDLVTDPRAALSPSDVVDRKLAHLLCGAPVGVSQTRSPAPGACVSMTSRPPPARARPGRTTGGGTQ